MKKILLFITFTICLLLTVGCGKTPQDPSGDTNKPASGTQTEVTVLDRLQSSIAEQNAMLGVAFFGYVDSESDEAAVRTFVAGSSTAKDYPFLADCAPILAEGAELYAFVPANKDTAVTVYRAELSEDCDYIDHKDTPLYSGQPGETVVLRCNISEIYSNVLISASDGTNTLEFRPMLSMKNGYVATEPGCYDFSVYGEGEDVSVEIARERLIVTDELRDAQQRGMKLLYTGDTQVVNGQQCLLFALGTEHEDQFVREQLYAVADDQIYAYSAVNDSWEPLGAG